MSMEIMGPFMGKAVCVGRDAYDFGYPEAIFYE